MNEMQKEISHKLIPILEESPKDNHTEALKNSKPEDLAPQNNHVKELTEKDGLIEEGKQQAMSEMSQIGQNPQDHVQMQNLHQSYEQKIQSLTLDCDRQIQKLQSKYDKEMQNQKELKSQKKIMKPRDIGPTIVQGIRQCQTYLYPIPTVSQHIWSECFYYIPA